MSLGSYILLLIILGIVMVTIIIAIACKNKKNKYKLTVFIPIVAFLMTYCCNSSFHYYVNFIIFSDKSITLNSDSKTFFIYLPKKTTYEKNNLVIDNINGKKYNGVAKFFYSQSSTSASKSSLTKI